MKLYTNTQDVLELTTVDNNTLVDLNNNIITVKETYDE
jgi:hypothetical protein